MTNYSGRAEGAYAFSTKKTRATEVPCLCGALLLTYRMPRISRRIRSARLTQRQLFLRSWEGCESIYRLDENGKEREAQTRWESRRLRRKARACRSAVERQMADIR